MMLKLKFKQAFLLICLGFGAFVPNVYANETKGKVDTKINSLVAQVFVKDAKNQALSVAWLKTALTTLKKEVLNVIQNHTEDYKDLHQALEELNLDDSNLPAVMPKLKNVVNKLPEKSQKFLKAKFPLLS